MGVHISANAFVLWGFRSTSTLGVYASRDDVIPMGWGSRVRVEAGGPGQGGRWGEHPRQRHVHGSTRPSRLTAALGLKNKIFFLVQILTSVLNLSGKNLYSFEIFEQTDGFLV